MIFANSGKDAGYDQSSVPCSPVPPRHGLPPWKPFAQPTLLRISQLRLQSIPLRSGTLPTQCPSALWVAHSAVASRTLGPAAHSQRPRNMLRCAQLLRKAAGQQLAAALEPTLGLGRAAAATSLLQLAQRQPGWAALQPAGPLRPFGTQDGSGDGAGGPPARSRAASAPLAAALSARGGLYAANERVQRTARAHAGGAAAGSGAGAEQPPAMAAATAAAEASVQAQPSAAEALGFDLEDTDLVLEEWGKAMDEGE